MNKLNNIAIKVEPTVPQAGPFVDSVLPLLLELETMLAQLVTTGTTSSIDLRRAPLGPQELIQLRSLLGRGEVSATIDALGPTQVEETAIAGVWWITHRNQDSQTVGEFIEITDCPELLKTQSETLQPALMQLRNQIAQQLSSADHP